MDTDLEKLRCELTQLDTRHAAAMIVAKKALTRAEELQKDVDELFAKADALRHRIRALDEPSKDADSE